MRLKGLEAQTCELKRLYVRPNARGQKIGLQLVEKAIGEARGAGYQRIILDSHISMKKAHAIYKAVGFRYVEAPDDFPERLKPVAVFMRLDL